MTAPTPTPDAETREALIEAAAKAMWEEADDEVGWEGTLSLAKTGDAFMVGQVQWMRDQAAVAVDAILSSGLVVPAAEVEETKRLLSDPNAVHINMLAGKIAKPSVEQIVHTYAGEVVPAHTVSDLAVMHMERDQAIADLAERDAQIARLREALQLMVDHDADYMAINHLGDPEVQQRICVARAALGETAP